MQETRMVQNSLFLHFWPTQVMTFDLYACTGSGCFLTRMKIMWKTLRTLTAMRNTTTGMENITSKRQLPTMTPGKKQRENHVHTHTQRNSCWGYYCIKHYWSFTKLISSWLQLLAFYRTSLRCMWTCSYLVQDAPKVKLMD